MNIPDAIEQVKPDAATTEPLGRAASVALLVTFLQRFAFAVSEVLLVFYLADLVKANIGYTNVEVGILSVVIYATQMLTAPPLGALSDRLGRRTMLLLTAAVGLFATLIPPLTSAFALLIANRALAGAANVGASPAGLALLTDATEASPTRRGRAVTWYEGTGLVGQIGSVVLSSVIWQLIGVGSFYIACALFAASLLLTAALVRESYRPHKAGDDVDKVSVDSGTWLALLRSPRLWAFAPIWIAANAILGMWYTYTAILLLSYPHSSSQVLVGSFNGQYIGAGLTFLVYGSVYGAGLAYWSGRVGAGSRMGIMLLASASVIAVSVLLLAFNHAGGSVLAWLLLLPAVAAVMGESAFVPAALAYLTDLAEHEGGTHNRGAVLGFFGTGNSIGNVLGVVIGLLFIQTLGLAFDGLLLGSIVLAIVALIVALPLYRKEREQIKERPD